MYNLDWSKLQKFSIDDQKRIMDAVRFACQAHFNQRRKSRILGCENKPDEPRYHEPFFLHPLEVAHICLESKGDVIEIVSALLHDVVEDTSVTLDEIEQHFGS
ncbi:MAG: bifunctional (p)ppGpp synthetase/guanosine-3',5'-bis(diphosphate) 3'-pyrophosphohydrolase, partial [Bacilli bacterium]|nr:bifunctional (p)ppGpp synthetase/guanosine-3',5'-bis(diphosphate) 3'-pyrophosphohydrolase [Bacilli bacterium]